MHLTKTPRRLAAILFFGEALLCAGILGILGNLGLSFSQGIAPESETRVLLLFISAVLGIAVLLAGVLLSPVPISKFGRLCLLLLCIVVALASLKFAQLLLLGWLFPLWYVFRFYRETDA